MLRKSCMEIFFIIFVTGFIGISSSPVFAQASENEAVISGQSLEELVIKGRVKRISHEKQTILVKPSKGDAVSIMFNEQTTLIDFDSFDEIKKKQPVKIRYKVHGDDNIAVKIEKLPELGC